MTAENLKNSWETERVKKLFLESEGISVCRKQQKSVYVTLGLLYKLAWFCHGNHGITAGQSSVTWRSCMETWPRNTTSFFLDWDKVESSLFLFWSLHVWWQRNAWMSMEVAAWTSGKAPSVLKGVLGFQSNIQGRLCISQQANAQLKHLEHQTKTFMNTTLKCWRTRIFYQPTTGQHSSPVQKRLSSVPRRFQAVTRG